MFAVGEFHGQTNNVKKLYYYLIVTKNAKYVADPQVADKPARG
jgi:hypothetical protein